MADYKVCSTSLIFPVRSHRQCEPCGQPPMRMLTCWIGTCLKMCRKCLNLFQTLMQALDNNITAAPKCGLRRNSRLVILDRHGHSVSSVCVSQELQSQHKIFAPASSPSGHVPVTGCQCSDQSGCEIRRGSSNPTQPFALCMHAAMRLQTRMGAVNMDDIRRERSSSLWQNRLKTASHFIDFCRTVLRYYDCSNYCLCRLHWEMEIAHLVEKSVSTDNSLPRNAMRDRQTPNIG